MKSPKPYKKLFTAHTVKWFERTLGKPTAVQNEAWSAIASCSDVLVSAPTGTGKTLSAFLVFIDQMMTQAREGTLEPELQLIYISPLKSLAGDIRENLYRPLNGIATECGMISPITTAIRTGDTSTADRTKMAKKPPHILITTPESLYLLLTSKSGQKMLKTTRAIIIDELHAMIDTKRGAHLMFSLARLDALCGSPLQRVGISATIQPLSLSADYLSNGKDSVQIVAPAMHKDFEIRIENPFPEHGALPNGTIWVEIARKVIEACEGARSVIAFTEGRLMTEQLAWHINKLAGEGFARTHHGSVSKELRFEVENDLRAGKLRLLVATSSMELGIDVGDIDKVLQISCPFSISSVMQRLGRAGHNPGRLSLMSIFPRTVSENLYCALTAQTAREGGIERSKPPRLCFDVLAQHLVSMATVKDYSVEEVMDLLPRAYPFRETSKEDVCNILEMLAGDYEHQRDVPVRPRLHYDRINEHVEGDNYSRMLAVSSPGTIPDMGLYAAKTESGVKVGDLDEEFVIEQRVGFKFMLGSFAWRITNINKDTVTVAPASPEGARPSWWRYGGVGRKLQTGLSFGRQMRELTEAAHSGNLLPALEAKGLDKSAAKDTADFIERQLEATELLPDDRTLIAEHFRDEIGLYQIMIHSVYGRQVNSPLAILLALIAKNLTGMDVDTYDDDDGILLTARGEEQTLPEGLLRAIRPETAKAILEAALPGTPLFNITFRHNAGRALMMGVRQNRRNPLWIQRLRANEMLDGAIHHAEHPLIRETKRECLEDHWDLFGLETLLTDIQKNTVQVRELYQNEPSPMSLPLRRKMEAEEVYNYIPVTDNVLSVVKESVDNVLNTSNALKPNPKQLERLSERQKLPENARELHTLLMIEGDLIAGELPIPLEWFEFLAEQGRCLYIEPGLWIAAEQEEMYRRALEGNEKV